MKLYVAYIWSISGDINLLSIWPTEKEAEEAAIDSLLEMGKEDVKYQDWHTGVKELPAYDCWEALTKDEERHMNGN